MFLQTKRLIPWKKKDYILTILHFLVHYLITVGIIVATVFINAGDAERFLDYFKGESVQNFIYILLATLFIFSIIYLYFYYEFRDYLLRAKNIAVVFVVIEFSLIVSYVMGKYVNIYSRPFALAALLILLLVNKRSACYVNFCFSLMVFIIDVFGNQEFSNTSAIYSSLVVGCASSMLAIYLVDGVGSRISVFAKGFLISIPIIICIVSLELDKFTLEGIVPYVLFGFISGILSVVLMMAIIPVFEWVFNIVTNYRLVEITDPKSKLIQKMKNEAPGTFNHCLLVSSLAESCAAAIGENAILARACAYYHDIGKIKQPQYFTENQHGVNPHDDLTPELSTEIIRSHTRDGYDVIKKYHLPLILADVAREHHGTLPIQYFYMKAQQYTDGELDISDFCYEGPKPHSKIAAIIMLADGCEAAVRAQNDRSHAKVEKVVRGIIEDRMNKDQFSECDITMRDLDIIRKTIEDSLTGVYHERINYPKLKVVHESSFNLKQDDGDSAKSGQKSTRRKRTDKKQ